MNERLRRILATVQELYLHDPELSTEAARETLVRQLAVERQQIAARIWDEEYGCTGVTTGADVISTALAAWRAAEDEVVEEQIIGRIADRALHERRNAMVYFEADLTAPLDHDNLDTAPENSRFWFERADAAGVDVGRRGPDSDSYGVYTIEDVALPPQLSWQAADQRVVMEKFIDRHGLEPGQWLELEWPPDGHLTTEGHVYWTEFEVCEAHSETYYETNLCEIDFEDCERCVQPERIVEFPAVWCFTTTVRTFEISFDTDGHERAEEVDRDDVTVGELEQDPDDILTGPPEPGRRW